MIDSCHTFGHQRLNDEKVHTQEIDKVVKQHTMGTNLRKGCATKILL